MPGEGMYTQRDPIGLAGGNPTVYGYVFDTLKHIDPFGLKRCNFNQLHKDIEHQLSIGKSATVKVKTKSEAEELLLLLTTGKKHPGAFMNTTKPKNPNSPPIFDPQSGASRWLPRASSFKRGTYHWDDWDPFANVGDHAREGSHLQIHTFKGWIIRIFFEGN